MKSHLKVKIVSLTAEMSYIRRQEEKWKSRARAAREKLKSDAYHACNFWSLRGHRDSLKTQARSTHLAYGFMKNIPYAAMENICYGPLKGFGGSEPEWAAIEAMVERFSKDEDNPQNTMQKFAEWLADAKIWYEANPERIKKLDAERPARIEALKALTAERKAAS